MYILRYFCCKRMSYKASTPELVGPSRYLSIMSRGSKEKDAVPKNFDILPGIICQSHTLNTDPHSFSVLYSTIVEQQLKQQSKNTNNIETDSGKRPGAMPTTNKCICTANATPYAPLIPVIIHFRPPRPQEETSHPSTDSASSN